MTGPMHLKRAIGNLLTEVRKHHIGAGRVLEVEGCLAGTAVDLFPHIRVLEGDVGAGGVRLALCTLFGVRQCGPIGKPGDALVWLPRQPASRILGRRECHAYAVVGGGARACGFNSNVLVDQIGHALVDEQVLRVPYRRGRGNLRIRLPDGLVENTENDAGDRQEAKDRRHHAAHDFRVARRLFLGASLLSLFVYVCHISSILALYADSASCLSAYTFGEIHARGYSWQV